MGCLIFCKYDMLRILIISVSCHKFDKTFRKTQSTIFKIIHCCIAKLHDIPCSPVYTSKLNLQYLSITVSYNWLQCCFFLIVQVVVFASVVIFLQFHSSYRCKRLASKPLNKIVQNGRYTSAFKDIQVAAKLPCLVFLKRLFFSSYAITFGWILWLRSIIWFLCP